ncbi:hypothetical protein Tco_0596055 [Tanacetum coccineum]
MSQPANDVFSQHLSDDETSFHEDASENGTAYNKPKQQQQQLIPITTTISNIKLPILKKEEYDIWAMEMEHYLEYIDNDVWKKAVSSPMVATIMSKLPMLNPGEFEIWKMRIEQYFLMTDYDLWEVIVNGDSPLQKRTVDGVEQTYPPTTTEA